MQTQEMYWKQKYDNLNDNYNILMNEYKNKQSTAKAVIGKYIVLLLLLFQRFQLFINCF